MVRKRNWHNARYCGEECALVARREYRPSYLREFAKRPIACVNEGVKICRACEREKHVTQFHKSTNYADGRQSRCSECRSNYDGKLKRQESQECRATRLERQRQRNRAWKAKNKDKVREYTARTTAQNTARHERWRRANPERFKVHIFASNHKRRQQKKGGMTGGETKAWFDAQKKVCHWCGANCADLPTIDHVAPLSKGGEHVVRNLVIACKPCNSRKHAKDPIEWAQMNGKLL